MDERDGRGCNWGCLPIIALCIAVDAAALFAACQIAALVGGIIAG